MTTPLLSVSIITFNEEHNIRDCLASVAWADEIVVVDACSTDTTVAICREFTERVIQRPWPGHVAQKQYALEQTRGSWVLCLDADERLSPEAADEVRTVISNAHAADGYTFPRLSFYLGRWIRHGGWYPDRKLRLVRRGCGRWTGMDPHDKLVVDGTVGHCQGHLYHYVYRDISQQLKTIDSFSRITASQWHRQGRNARIIDMLVRPPLKFIETYVWKRGFLDGMPGFIIAVLSSYYVFLKYAKLWEFTVLRHSAEH
ncbi:MAG: glycosyltransferase family 2 protein [Desulfobacterota bacterium]|nr:glycosyltransferase family 2 protein [Thermodesulfobacteriota bacterium]